MKQLIYLLVILTALGLFACAGEDNPDVDTTPPVNPTLIPHLGDWGDPPVWYDSTLVVLNESTNGLDTVPEGNWIRLTWKPFIDTDLSHIKIYRFDEVNTNPVLIDSIMSNSTEYLDSKTQLEERTIYSYFIDLVDAAGNEARSDTVSYGLLSKCILTGPDNNASVIPGHITFSWDVSGTVSKCRVIVMDENYNYIWHNDWVSAFPEDPEEMVFPVNLAQQHSGQTLRWRVDALDWSETLQDYMGSESQERVFHIQ
ncbi:MAG TPA: hypothetical protein PL124_04515 [Candidatus Cloacimonadota bacterium]|nr:hypothetical protein [Candidatus Cloacimonadota bacterium]HPS38656.1 hypothetical protein [Candidatus Cloacimonadota bacterium]